MVIMRDVYAAVECLNLNCGASRKGCEGWVGLGWIAIGAVA